MKLNLLKKLKELLENSVVYTECLQAAALQCKLPLLSIYKGEI